MKAARHFIVDINIAPTRLDHFLATQAPDLSRSRIQALIKEGQITLNAALTKPNVKLRGGENIQLIEPPVTSSDTVAENIPLAILYEDEDLIVINKPSGLVVHPSVGHATGTLVNALLHHCHTLSGIGGVERPGIVHRLDKETSGCMVAAKNDHAHQSLTRQFAERGVRKIYLALASGNLTRKSGEVNVPIGRHPIHRQKMAVSKPGKGREARTTWRNLGSLPCGTFIECTLHTGRTHQIRVHFKHLGHPLLGDEVYGKRANFSRLMLHAWKLGFNHPKSETPMDFLAPIPNDFIDLGANL